MLSKTSKLGAYSWSLQALATCPGAVDAGKVVEVCSVCYARGGSYRFAVVKRKRERNKEDWQQPDWIDRMVAAISDQQYFVWFDSGDMYSLDLASKILRVMELTPNTKHWLRTRMHKFRKFRSVIDQMNALPNVVARQSADNFDEVLDVRPSASVISSERLDIFTCRAYTRDNKCHPCRACWDKSVPVVGYIGHGAKYRRIIKLKEVNHA